MNYIFIIKLDLYIIFSCKTIVNHRNLIALATVLIGYFLVSSAFVGVTPISSVEGQDSLTRAERNWEFINHNKFGTNFNPQTQMNKDNVQHVELKWIYPIPSANQLGGGALTNFGSVTEGTTAPPLIVDGVVFVILNSKTIIATDAETGKLLWEAEHPGADNNANTVQEGGNLPITGELVHTHSMNYWDGILWFTDFGCTLTGLDAKTGDLVKSYPNLCLERPLDLTDEVGYGLPGNSGLYGSLQPHAPIKYEKGNSIFYSDGGAAEGTWGGRMYMAAYDYDSGELQWRTYLMPPCGDPTTCGPGKDGPLFLEEKEQRGQWLVDNCDKIWVQTIKSCEMNQDILRNDWGTMRSNSGISNVWGQNVVDEETGILYFGTAQAGPDWNGSYSPGPRLFGASVIALDANNGELIWAHQTTARDLWDYDCSWNTMLTTTVVKGEERKVVIKGCKNGIVYVLDAATGEAYHLLEPPAIKRTEHSQLYDPLNDADMLKPWANYPSTDAWVQNCWAAGCLESDIVFDSGRNMIFFGTYNAPSYVQVVPVEERGNMGLNFAPEGADWFNDWLADTPSIVNATINAYDVDTGELKWTYDMLGTGFRGGVIVSGGVVWMSSIDGFSTALDADTGEVLYRLNMGLGSSIMPTIAADANGDIKLFRPQGAGFVGNANWGPGQTTSPGAIMVYGLPDVIPEPEVIIEQVEVEVEVEVEKIVEVEKEVEVTVETISPVSYVIIGLGLVAIIVAGILYQRTRQA